MSTSTTAGDLPQRMRRIIRGLAASRDETTAELAQALDMHESKLFRRFQAGKWTAEELDGLARHFEVSVAVFFGDPTEIFGAGAYRPTNDRSSDENGTLPVLMAA